jgi:alkyl hydroperoxide reductase subunit F
MTLARLAGRKDFMLDTLIIGAGVAGMSAALYCARRKLNFKLISKDIGGQTGKSSDVENYLGVWGTGAELIAKMNEQLKRNGIESEVGKTVKKITLIDKTFVAELENGEKIEAKSVIVTAGKLPRRLNIPGESELEGKGVTYCATCDGPLYKNKTVAVIGGGNSALDSALMLSQYADKIYILNINPEFKGEKVLIDKVLNDPKIEVIPNAQTIKINGTETVESLEYLDKISNQTKNLAVQGIFVEIGWVTKSDFIDPKLVEKNEWDEIKIDLACRTKTPGLFAAGDFTEVPYKQSIIAAGEGAKAALSAIDYLMAQKEPN